MKPSIHWVMLAIFLTGEMVAETVLHKQEEVVDFYRHTPCGAFCFL
jgi:hypothetical protein